MSEETKPKHHISRVKHTWMGRNMNGVVINPKIRDQNDLLGTACVHHSFCPLIETRQKIIDPSNKHTVDIRWLIKTIPRPCTSEKLVRTLVNQHGGDIKASKIQAFPFKVRAANCYDVSSRVSSKDRRENMEKVLNHLKFIGPVIGSFYPDIDYEPVSDGIYVSKGTRKVVTCPECDREIKVRHAVCVVGTAIGMVNGKETPCFQYLESDNPVKYSGKEDGICFMTSRSMDTITIIE